MNELIKEIKQKKLGKIIENISLKEYTSYKTGGICRLMVFPKDVKSLISLLKIIDNYKVKFKILGNGSNTLFSSKLYQGIIIKLDNLNKIKLIGNQITVGSGYNLINLSLFAMKNSLSGLEFAAGIPGTVGGAVFMNAGAYKSDMGYIVKKVKVLTPNYKIIYLTNSDMNFHYRTSFLQEHKDYICLEALIKLKLGKKEEISAIMRERKEKRIAAQPLEYPSCGSVFRNPEGLFAGKLIEDLGFKGLYKGGAQISDKHANFIINKNNATSEDIKELIDFTKEAVLEKYNIDLKVEQELVNWE
ncbi:MAG: UDP-N-acetylmuramate dehydrogenase [Bacilli bacterium]